MNVHVPGQDIDEGYVWFFGVRPPPHSNASLISFDGLDCWCFGCSSSTRSVRELFSLGKEGVRKGLDLGYLRDWQKIEVSRSISVIVHRQF